MSIHGAHHRLVPTFPKRPGFQTLCASPTPFPFPCRLSRPCRPAPPCAVGRFVHVHHMSFPMSLFTTRACRQSQRLLMLHDRAGIFGKDTWESNWLFERQMVSLCSSGSPCLANESFRGICRGNLSVHACACMRYLKAMVEGNGTCACMCHLKGFEAQCARGDALCVESA